MRSQCDSWMGKIPWRRDRLPTPAFIGFPGGSDDKKSSCDAGDLGFIPGLGRSPGGGCGNPLQYSFLENPHRQRSLVGYSPWGRKESDLTERLNTHTICTCAALSWVQLFQTPWTVVRQTPLSVGFPRQEYWEILPFSPSRGSSQLRDWTPISMCPALQVDFCHWATWGSPLHLLF